MHGIEKKLWEYLRGRDHLGQQDGNGKLLK
jgi:hypothetical protein